MADNDPSISTIVPARRLTALGGWLCGGALLLLGGWGCVRMPEAPPTLPDRNAVIYDQLVVYSDAGVPRTHRLFDELRTQRQDLLSLLNLPASNEPIYVYLFESEPRFREFLDRVHPNLPRRRAFFVEDDDRLTVYAQWSDRAAEDLRHEVTHGYLHSVVPNLPLWLDEGLAEYFEVPRSDAGVNQPHVQLLIDRMASGWKPDLRRLEQLPSAGAMAQQDYAESWAWTYWLLESDPELRRWLQGYLAALREHGQVEPLSIALARRVENSDQQVVAFLGRWNSTARVK